MGWEDHDWERNLLLTEATSPVQGTVRKSRTPQDR